MYLTMQKYQQTAEKSTCIWFAPVDMPSLDQLLFAQYY